MGSPAGLSSGPHTACPGTLTWDYTVGGDGTHGDGSQHRLQRHRLSSQKTGHLGGHTQPHHRGAAKQSGTWAPGHSGLPRSPTQPPKLSSCRAPRNTQLRTLPGMKGRPCLGAHLPWRMGRTPSGCLPTVGYKGDPIWVPAHRGVQGRPRLGARPGGWMQDLQSCPGWLCLQLPAQLRSGHTTGWGKFATQGPEGTASGKLGPQWPL